MRSSLRGIAIAGVMLVLATGALITAAQDQGGGQGGRMGRGNFDPEQMRGMMMQRIQESLKANDDEWKALQPLVENVMEKQRQNRGMGGFMGGMRFGGGPGGPGGPGAGPMGGPGGPGAQDGQRQGRRGGFAPEANPEMDALRTALDSESTSADDIKAKLTALRDSQKKKEAELKQAREELRGVLTVRQEAQLVLMGLLD